MSKRNIISEEEKNEWLESLDYIQKDYGSLGVNEILQLQLNHALNAGIVLNEVSLNTPYVNTISVQQQPIYPGDLQLEQKIENIIRWNAIAMVLQAFDSGDGLGGHIATYASAATMLETGFHHCFQGTTDDYSGDMVLPQPHASPGIYARAFLEGRLSLEQLKNFRRELAKPQGLSSYPHPRSMPDFWEMPNASMGLSAVCAIYQARFAQYLQARGLKNKENGKIWCFIGDGESDEPEVLGSIGIAAREKLDNLIFVVNCNLQRLDGPVRGNGKIIQELERAFRGQDWNVIKVIWGSGWDVLLANDHDNVLKNRMEKCLDGDYQRYSVMDGGAQRELWVDNSPELKKMMDSLTDQEVGSIKRGGEDAKKIYAAYKQAMATQGKPTVILIKSVKGGGMGAAVQGKNTVHQKKDLNPSERIEAAKNLGIPITPEEATMATFYKPDDDSAEMAYLKARRQALGGYLPMRTVNCSSLPEPDIKLFEKQLNGTAEGQKHSTTMVLTRLISQILRDPTLGQYIVPIVPDEARTFGMETLFATAGIYSPQGQQYTPVDADLIQVYREKEDGQVLQEGICEAGAMASFIAAGTSYAVHGVPMIPFYVFYSMFGFQRVGDMIWAAADMMTRGFLLGGTAGRTTLNGEGLQHQDGHSHILATTVPSLLSYDPAFGYEVAIIIKEGIRRMYQEQENIFYYLTLYNESYAMPSLKQEEQTDVAHGIIQGGYLLQQSNMKKTARDIHLLASGAIMQEALSAAATLEEMGFTTHVWSITSFSQLARQAQAIERDNLHHPTARQQTPYITKLFKHHTGVCIAVTDYMKALPESISRWVPLPYHCLGTDGFGRSESRDKLRDYFEINANHIIRVALASLYQQKLIQEKDLLK